MADIKITFRFPNGTSRGVYEDPSLTIAQIIQREHILDKVPCPYICEWYENSSRSGNPIDTYTKTYSADKNLYAKYKVPSRNLAIWLVASGGTSYDFSQVNDDFVIPYPQPQEFTWKNQDVSSSDAGRSDSGLMYKNKIGTATKLECKWSGLTTYQLNNLLTAFESNEYIDIRYVDPTARNGTAYAWIADINQGFSVRNFYIGDRSSPMFNPSRGLWENFSVNFIERGVH